MRARGICSAVLLVLVVSMGMAGCGLNMEGHYKKIRPNLVAHNYEAADAYIESVKDDFYGEKNRLLYYMDKGMVLHLGKRYVDSSAFLEKAKTAADDLWTESVGEHAASWLTTDNSMSYQGEDFEKVLIHFVAALNYLGAGEVASARVEARQITNKLELYAAKYDEEHEGDKDQKKADVYRDDAFARWLSGKFAETEGGSAGLNDAWIDYRKAIKLYETDYAERYATSLPSFVTSDALRVLSALGPDFREEFEALRSRFPEARYDDAKKASGMGEIVLIHLNGEAPYKVDRFWQAQAGTDLIRIAFPEFVARPMVIRSARMRVGDVVGMSEKGQDVTAIAIRNLQDHMVRIKVKAIARQVAKYLAGKAAEAGGKELGGTGGAALQVAGFLWNAGSAIAEEADKRSWLTLPGAVNVGRILVAPGDVTVAVDFLSASGAVVEQVQMPARVEAGKTAFLTYRTYR